MEILDSFSSSDGDIIRLIEYDNYSEKLKNGGCCAIEYITPSRTSKKIYNYLYLAKRQFHLEEHRDYIAKVNSRLISINKLAYYKENDSYKDIIYFLRYCCDFKEIIHPDSLGISPVQIVSFVKKTNIPESYLTMVGKYKEYAREIEPLDIDVCIETNPFDGSIINRIIVNIDINNKSKRIFYLENEINNIDRLSNTTIFMYCYAANMYNYI